MRRLVVTVGFLMVIAACASDAESSRTSSSSSSTTSTSTTTSTTTTSTTIPTTTSTTTTLPPTTTTGPAQPEIAALIEDGEGGQLALDYVEWLAGGSANQAGVRAALLDAPISDELRLFAQLQLDMVANATDRLEILDTGTWGDPEGIRDGGDPVIYLEPTGPAALGGGLYTARALMWVKRYFYDQIIYDPIWEQQPDGSLRLVDYHVAGIPAPSEEENLVGLAKRGYLASELIVPQDTITVTFDDLYDNGQYTVEYTGGYLTYDAYQSSRIAESIIASGGDPGDPEAQGWQMYLSFTVSTTSDQFLPGQDIFMMVGGRDRAFGDSFMMASGPIDRPQHPWVWNFSDPVTPDGTKATTVSRVMLLTEEQLTQGGTYSFGFYSGTGAVWSGSSRGIGSGTITISPLTIPANYCGDGPNSYGCSGTSGALYRASQG